MLAEWNKHKATFVIWPHSGTNFDNLSLAQSAWQTIINNLLEVEQVYLITSPDAVTLVKRVFKSHSCYKNLNIIEYRTNDVWAQDYLPLCDVNMYYHDFVFNGWGEKYSHDLDDGIVRFLMAQGLLENVISHPVVAEGGNFDCDAYGNIWTNYSCLNHANRKNPVTVDDLKHIFQVKDIYCIESEPIVGDDTDGHIDTLMRGLPNKVFVCNDEMGLTEQIEALGNFDVVELPKPKFGNFPANYCNFYFANEIVLLPIYKDDSDKEVFEIMRELLPKYQIIPIDARELVMQGGSIHCALAPIFAGG